MICKEASWNSLKHMNPDSAINDVLRKFTSNIDHKYAVNEGHATIKMSMIQNGGKNA